METRFYLLDVNGEVLSSYGCPQPLLEEKDGIQELPDSKDDKDKKWNGKKWVNK